MIGRFVRRLAGPLEPALAEAYRGFFFDLDDFAGRIARLGSPSLVFEIGCGEGALATRLLPRLPDAGYVGVDISPQVGRLYQGRRAGVRFEQIDAETVAQRVEAQADLVLLCDVMHHAPAAARSSLWRAAARALRPVTGRLLFKEWVRNRTPAYHLGYLSDRYITGDRVRYGSRTEWLDEAAQAGFAVLDEWSLRPWSANHAFVLGRAE